MGIDISKTYFTAQDYVDFSSRLEDNLELLHDVLQRPGFGAGPGSLGAELEIYIVDAEGHPLHLNQEILTRANDPQLTLELNRYNLEYNLSPRNLADSPFAGTEREIVHKLDYIDGIAAQSGGRIVPIGILPTLRKTDFGPDCVTDRLRYHALIKQLTSLRGGEFQIDINGADSLKLAMASITLEGANTSFQVHYKVAPAAYADTYNALQLMTPLALAIGANSPMLFGRSLWQETRIPLFKQSIDTRDVDRFGWKEPARVNFGHGWVRRGAEELFSETVRVYSPLLPICAAGSGRDEMVADEVPALDELRLHQSTVWLWNRPVYDDMDGGHLRVEMRALPAGPTAVDMVANAALLIGLAEGIRPQVNALLPALPFRIAEHNFYRAAQWGLAAKLVWPSLNQAGCRERSITEIIREMLPVARQGLDAIGIAAAESGRYLAVIERRLESGQTGAVWQQKMLEKLQKTLPPKAALHQLLEAFIKQSRTNTPVAEWSL